jgi:hypothetical protein
LAKMEAGKGQKTSRGDEVPGGKTKPLPNGGGSKKVKGREEVKVASGVAATETVLPPVKKRGRPRKEGGSEDKDGGNADNGPPRKKVRRSDELAMAEVDQVTGPRVRVRTEKGQAQGGPTRK